MERSSCSLLEFQFYPNVGHLRQTSVPNWMSIRVISNEPQPPEWLDIVRTTDDFDLFHGETTDSYAHVYVNHSNDLGELKVEGQIRGPFSEYAQTLPATFQFTDMGTGDSVLGRAIVADPCSWTPKLPSTYHVDVRVVEADGNVVAQCESEMGIRRLGAVKKSFSLDGERWVMRVAGLDVGDTSAEALKNQLRDFRESHLACAVSHPTSEMLDIATKLGVFVFVTPESAMSEDDRNEQLLTLSRYPCVAAVAFEKWPESGISRKRIPNLLLGTSRVDADHDCDFSFIPLSSLDGVTGNKPIVVYQPMDVSSVVEKRTAVEALQAKVCPKSLAGYCLLG